jgi:hypothetical protein
MRDALSTFDQLVNFTQGNLTRALCLENLNMLDEEYYWTTFLDALESDGDMSIERGEMQARDLGEALCRRYPITYDDGTTTWGGYVEFMVSGPKCYGTFYWFPDAKPAGVKDTVCSWLDPVEYLSPEKPIFLDSEWVTEEADGKWRKHSFEGASIELPEAWHQDKSEDHDGDDYWFENDHLCNGFMGVSPGATSGEESVAGAKATILEAIGEEYGISDEDIEEINSGVAPRLRIVTRLDDDLHHYVLYDAILSGKDMYTLSLMIPGAAADAFKPVAIRIADSFVPENPKAPEFKGGSAKEQAQPEGGSSGTSSQPRQTQAQPAPAQAKPQATTTSSETVSQKNAVAKAKSYLDYSSFSYAGLVDQLEFEGFTTDQATYGANNCGADWYEQAYQKALSYLDYSSFSHSGLVDQLVFEGFTAEQAEYGVGMTGL